MQPDLVVATLLWDGNENTNKFSHCYNEGWVEKLYFGFRRNLTAPFRFVCYVDRLREMLPIIEQRLLNNPKPTYGDCIQPYEMNSPMILVGLDTIVTGNIDHLAEYCVSASVIALPRDPYAPERACNGVALVPGGNRHIFDNWSDENDMDWMRSQPHRFIDDLFPEEVVSYKGKVIQHGVGKARIVYFHGYPKAHELTHVPWVQQHWRSA